MKEYAAMAIDWCEEQAINHIVSGVRFYTKEEAEQYGEQTFGNLFVAVVEFSE